MGSSNLASDTSLPCELPNPGDSPAGPPIDSGLANNETALTGGKSSKFQALADRVSAFQHLTTFADAKVRAQLPKTQHFMVTYDEVVEKPYRAKFSIFTRPNPFMGFLVPEGVDIAAFSEHLMNVAKEMKKTKKQTGKYYGLYRDVELYCHSIFGERQTAAKKQSNKKEGTVKKKL